MPRTGRRLSPTAPLVLALLLAGAAAARAQPYGTWLVFNPGYPSSHGYVSVPHSPALNPTAAFTLEAWVNLSNSSVSEDCRSIAGKNRQAAWWVGGCTVAGEQSLRSYLKGVPRTAGIIPRGVWTHVAVVFTGAERQHYVNGELAGAFPEAAPLATSSAELRIGSDVAWERSPLGGIDEVRLWSTARTQAQLRAWINRPIGTPQPGLVAVWALDSSAQDVVGPHDGSAPGEGLFVGEFVTFDDCSGFVDPFTLCIDGRFGVTVDWRTGPAATPTDGPGHVAVSSQGTGIFWFFAANNWEVMVKALDGCGLNDRFWVFSAATTNVFYRLVVYDAVRGAQKIYFNYPGPPAPAVTDTDAFATCP